jgi:hypothetical protein
MERKTPEKRARLEKFNCKVPLVFAIPLDVYADEVGKDRDKTYFLKMQQLQKTCDQIRESLYSYSQQQVIRLKITNFLIERSKTFKSPLSKEN